MAKSKKKPGAQYFTDIARTGDNKVILAGHYYALEDSDDFRTAIVTLRDDVWGCLDVSGIAHAVRFFQGDAHDPKRQYWVLDRNKGLYRIYSQDNVKFEKINKDRVGFLMDLRQIGEHWYAVGGHHQIYREDKGKWKAIDKGIYIEDESGDTKVLLSIDGIAEDDIYTVGFGGVILHYNGKKWTELDTPTNVGLQRVLCVSENEIYICGNANALYRGNINGWQALTEPDSAVTFWDMAYFKGKVYVCTKKKLFTIEADGIKEVKINVEGPLGFYRLAADDKELWTCGNECVLKFDGKKWTQYIYPDNT